jgi:hypothetical protein
VPSLQRVARSTYYATKDRILLARAFSDAVVTRELVSVWEAGHGVTQTSSGPQHSTVYGRTTSEQLPGL